MFADKRLEEWIFINVFVIARHCRLVDIQRLETASPTQLTAVPYRTLAGTVSLKKQCRHDYAT